jgi:predicted aminopeptidase
VDVHRKYVVWNVQAAPQFSLEPKSWWYPFVGSLEYRGYFSDKDAHDCGDRLAKKGFDVSVDGIEAYSTLGWFKDPLLNTFIDTSEPELAEVLFHELGHKRVFASGDTDFNEAFATTVGQEGAHRWLLSKCDMNLLEKYDAALARDQQFVHLIMATRERLEKVYGDTLDKDGNVTGAKIPPAPPEELRREKQHVFDDLRRQYTEMKSEWGGYSGYDEWFAHELNNAKLNTIANYYDYLPGFQRLLQLNGGDVEKFYVAVERLSKEPKDRRHQKLRELAKEK